jgi:hypothetical protein
LVLHSLFIILRQKKQKEKKMYFEETMRVAPLLKVREEVLPQKDALTAVALVVFSFMMQGLRLPVKYILNVIEALQRS